LASGRRVAYIRTVSPTQRAAAAVLIAGAAAATASVLSQRYAAPPIPHPAQAAGAWQAFTTAPVLARDTFTRVLERAGLSVSERLAVVSAVRGCFDFRKLRPGTEMTLAWSRQGSLESIVYPVDADRRLHLSRNERGFSARLAEVPSTIRTVVARGTIRGSLFASMERAGERPELAMQIADVFAWDLDFYTDPREGDEFEVLIEKKEYSNGQAPVYLRILAARYNNAGTLYEAFLFPDADGKPRYFSRDGRALQAAFLRSPLKFDARISSHFSFSRLHPVLKIRRPHFGTDYAAPAGAPVQAIAGGVVTMAGYNGGAGNMIAIRHANGYETQYLHLSRIFVRSGQRVEQGQQIGLVGSTGLSTGPHLDFRVRRNGGYVNFERLRPPRLDPLSPAEKQAFARQRDQYAAMLREGRSSPEVLSAGAHPPGQAASPPRVRPASP